MFAILVDFSEFVWDCISLLNILIGRLWGRPFAGDYGFSFSANNFNFKNKVAFLSPC